MESKRRKALLKIKRAMRVRKKLRGTATCPRMCVVKSNKHLHVQLIDDESGHTLASVATYSSELRSTEFSRKSKASARKLGEVIADHAKQKNISEVIFDRGPNKYHGVLAELADAARSGGLKF